MIDLLVAAVISIAPIDPAQDCNQAHPCYNGHEPSYNDPDCWPGAIYCAPAESVSHGHGRGRK